MEEIYRMEDCPVVNRERGWVEQTKNIFVEDCHISQELDLNALVKKQHNAQLEIMEQYPEARDFQTFIYASDYGMCSDVEIYIKYYIPESDEDYNSRVKEEQEIQDDWLACKAKYYAIVKEQREKELVKKKEQILELMKEFTPEEIQELVSEEKDRHGSLNE